jgi:photosystem II stability/assembly factor-like uncharacterized protein
MRLLHLTFLYCMVNVFSAGPALEHSPSVSTCVLNAIKAPTITTRVAPPGATNIIYQSNDGGQTWQDISFGLPENELPQGFFAEASEVYVRGKDAIYRSKSNLKKTVWEKQNALDPRSTSIVFNRSHEMPLAAEGVLLATGQQGIKRSTDAGGTWEWVISEGGVGIALEKIKGGFAAIAFNTKTQSRRIHISLDNGKTWKVISDGLPPSMSITSIKQAGQYLLCGHPDGIFRSSDMGKTWSLVHPGVDKNNDKRLKVFNNDSAGDPTRVFTIHVSGTTVYAVAGNAGC